MLVEDGSPGEFAVGVFGVLVTLDVFQDDGRGKGRHSVEDLHFDVNLREEETAGGCISKGAGPDEVVNEALTITEEGELLGCGRNSVEGA